MSASSQSEALMYAHLSRVFGDRDASRRRRALQELYVEDATLFEPNAKATGYDAISRAVDALYAQMPPDYVFRAAGQAAGHDGVARLNWRAGPPQGPPAVTGTDVALIENGRIKTLFVFVDPMPK